MHTRCACRHAYYVCAHHCVCMCVCTEGNIRTPAKDALSFIYAQNTCKHTRTGGYSRRQQMMLVPPWRKEIEYRAQMCMYVYTFTYTCQPLLRPTLSPKQQTKPKLLRYWNTNWRKRRRRLPLRWALVCMYASGMCVVCASQILACAEICVCICMQKEGMWDDVYALFCVITCTLFHMRVAPQGYVCTYAVCVCMCHISGKYVHSNSQNFTLALEHILSWVCARCAHMHTSFVSIFMKLFMHFKHAWMSLCASLHVKYQNVAKCMPCWDHLGLVGACTCTCSHMPKHRHWWMDATRWGY